MKINEIAFLTSNPKKAEDFSRFGFSIQEFHTDLPEIQSADVAKVALYKALSTGLNNILVEDTSLHVDGASFSGTEIKHVWEEIKENQSFDKHNAKWEIALCLKKDDNFYVSTSKLEGKLKYPLYPTGYHFDRLFSVWQENQYSHFEALSGNKKLEIGPRFQALRQLIQALETNNYKNISVIKAIDVLPWNGMYQIEKENRMQIKNKF